ncbi:J domain-containing protein [Chrysiogenes arsenatis]|uniref:J domain-containing protein n=1 Tax=Chrysiogenes arsenatis TaxID=309797 RepID=UPI0003F91FE2|nr:J domain-containing protein [Chrysiogenes arsenatis]
MSATDIDTSYPALEQALEIFGLTARFTRDHVRRAYHRLSKLHHPDNGGSDEMMVKVNAAHALLEHYMQHYHFQVDRDEFLRQNPYHRFMNQFHQDGVWNYRDDATERQP